MHGILVINGEYIYPNIIHHTWMVWANNTTFAWDAIVGEHNFSDRTNQQQKHRDYLEKLLITVFTCHLQAYATSLVLVRMAFACEKVPILPCGSQNFGTVNKSMVQSQFSPVQMARTGVNPAFLHIPMISTIVPYWDSIIPYNTSKIP